MLEIKTERELHALFDDSLDEAWGTEILGTYSAAEVLKLVDPTAYRVGFNDWLDAFETCDDCSSSYDLLQNSAYEYGCGCDE